MSEITEIVNLSIVVVACVAVAGTYVAAYTQGRAHGLSSACCCSQDQPASVARKPRKPRKAAKPRKPRKAVVRKPRRAESVTYAD